MTETTIPNTSSRQLDALLSAYDQNSNNVDTDELIQLLREQLAEPQQDNVAENQLSLFA